MAAGVREGIFRSGARARSPAGRIVVIGDSHIHAVQEALKARGSTGTAVRIEAQRLLKMKQLRQPAESAPGRGTPGSFTWARRTLKGRRPAAKVTALGDISFNDAIRIARRLRSEDILVSVIGGNQHAVLSTIQHPKPFDFMLPEETHLGEPVSGTELIPFHTLYSFFGLGLRNGDAKTIQAFRSSTSARMIHLLAPPPKRMNEWIEQHHDTLFVAEGLGRQGVSRPELRLKFWQLQNRALEEICAELGVEVLGPPADALDPNGFLARPYYAGDATHANLRYGELVLQQLEAVVDWRRTNAEVIS